MFDNRSKMWGYATAIGLAIAAPIAGLVTELVRPESALREVFDRGALAAAGRYIHVYLTAFTVPLIILFCLVTAIWQVFSSRSRRRKQTDS